MGDVFRDYMWMAQGETLNLVYTLEMENADFENPGNPLGYWPSWWLYERDLLRICEARGVRRLDVMRTTAPKPSTIENWVYCAELREKYGDLSSIVGFDTNGNLRLPRGAGIIGPVREDGEIVRINFWPYSRLFRKSGP